ncbi:uncharacterized protein LOC133182165 [Saccostrea echinata]|uniref:uncharacterized protein LOC133182165 n=1 Tax=Saccostrea echinata TaxID=191078 RepID=UPI002A806780|nr:uncharacterized protein LOC133182165 [Saccostrea echinata]
MNYYTSQLWKYIDFAVGTEEDVQIRREINRVYVDTKNVCRTSHEFISGSAAEGFKFLWSDLDIMWSFPIYTVVTEWEESNHSKNIEFIASDKGCKPGFYKLLPYYCANLKTEFGNVSDDDCFSRIRFLEEVRKHGFNKNIDSTIHGPCIASFIPKEHDICSCLPIHSVSSNKFLKNFSTKFWNNLKSRLLKKSITVMHMVPKGPTEGDVKGIQWLKSFSVLEQQIVHSLNHVQFCCYGLLKIVIRDRINAHIEIHDTLCSYHLKTVLFHVLEDVHSDFWIPSNIFCCFWICFTRLLLFVRKGVCPNYFLPECNLFRKERILTRKGKIEEILFDVLKYGPRYLVHVCTISSLDNPAFLLQHVHKSKKLRDFITFSFALIEAKGYQTSYRECMLSIVKIFKLFESETDDRIVAALKYLFIGFIKRAGVILYERFVLTKFTEYLLSAEAAFILERNFLASGGLHLATVWYCQGKYNYAIEVLHHVLNKLSESALLCVINNDSLQRDIDNPSCSFTYLTANYCSWHIYLYRNSSFCPKDLKNDVCACAMNEFVMYDKSYALFLMFLCNLEIGQRKSCTKNLEKLKKSFKDYRCLQLGLNANENSKKLALIAEKRLKELI